MHGSVSQPSPSSVAVGVDGALLGNGVAYNDVVDDDFFTPGASESLGGLRVSVYAGGTTTMVASGTTFSSGGYTIAVPANGTYDVRFVGTNIDETISGVTIGNQNVKVDAIDPGNNPPGTGDEFRITKILLMGSDVRLTWQAVPGAKDEVWTSTQLSGSTKIADSATTGPPAGDTASHTHSAGATGERRYYYVRRL